MNPRSASNFLEICNGKIAFVTKYTVALNILIVISYDSVVLSLIDEKRRKRIFKVFSANTPVKIQG